MAAAPILIIGFGNPLLADEGIGIYAVGELTRRYRLPDSVEVLDGGTSSVQLYEKFVARERVIVADAVVTDGAPGSLIRLCDEQIPAFFQSRLSPHQMGLPDTLALVKTVGVAPKRVTVIGMVPDSVEPGSRLTEPARAGLDAMIGMIIDELQMAGITPIPRSNDRTGRDSS